MTSSTHLLLLLDASLLNSQISFHQLLNLDGLYLGDRTSTMGPVFEPNQNNTRYMYGF